jgi:hypothetical protein
MTHSMVTSDRLRRVIDQSSELSRQGDNSEALELLDGEIACAVRENRGIWVATLSRHASAIADQMGDLSLVRRYREQCLAHDPDNPLTLLSLAEVLDRQGEGALAKEYAVKSYQFSVGRESELDRAIVESISKQWPEIGKR